MTEIFDISSPRYLIVPCFLKMAKPYVYFNTKYLFKVENLVSLFQRSNSQVNKSLVLFST